MSVGMMQNIELILTVGISFIVGIAYGVWLANDIKGERSEWNGSNRNTSIFTRYRATRAI